MIAHIIHVFPGFTCMDAPMKNPEDTVWLEPTISGLQVKPFTTELCRVPPDVLEPLERKLLKILWGKKEKMLRDLTKLLAVFLLKALADDKSSVTQIG